MNSLKNFLIAAIFTGAISACAPLPVSAQSILTPMPAQSALRTLIAQSPSPLPLGTKLFSVTITDGLATTNFSHELQDNFRGGDTEEANVVNAVLTTLGAFPTVSRVQILVGGSAIDSLGGLISIVEPLPVIRSVSISNPPIRRFHRRHR